MYNLFPLKLIVSNYFIVTSSLNSWIMGYRTYILLQGFKKKNKQRKKYELQNYILAVRCIN